MPAPTTTPLPSGPDSMGRDRAIAYVLWVTVGFLGAHRFYWGKWRTGAAQLGLPLLGLLLFMVGWSKTPDNLDIEQLAVAVGTGFFSLSGMLLILAASVWSLVDGALILTWGPRQPYDLSRFGR